MSSDGKTRRPRAFDVDDPTIKVSDPPPDAPEDETDAENHEQTDHEEHSGLGDADSFVAATPPQERGGVGWFGVFLSALVALAGLAFSLWYANFVSVALMRDDWLGWTARGLAALIAISLTVMLLREVFGMMRLNRLGRLRGDSNKAQTAGDFKLAQKTVSRLKSQLSGRRDARWSLDRFREQERHMRDAPALLGLADRVLLEPADKQAQELIFQSARRVGIVSAVVPIAFIVMLFVTFENLRMVRRLAGAYGGRPGFFGGLRLFSWIIGHVAASGAIALTDDLWGQFFGQDMLRRVSAKLGEGAFNAALTARLGVAALEICRPLPFIEAKPPRARHVFYQVFPDLRPELMKRVWKND
ncbi:MAG: TIGR01620 family protein [Filomicrobium sp.]